MSTLTVTKAKRDIALLSSDHMVHAIWNWYYACVYYWLIKTGESRSSSTETSLVIALCFLYMRHNKTPTTNIFNTRTLSLFNRRYNFFFITGYKGWIDHVYELYVKQCQNGRWTWDNSHLGTSILKLHLSWFLFYWSLDFTQKTWFLCEITAWFSPGPQ